jgi:hypothetical protein
MKVASTVRRGAVRKGAETQRLACRLLYSLVEFRKGRLKTPEPLGRGSLKARDGRLPNLSHLQWSGAKGP